MRATSFCTYSPVVGARSACILAASARNSPSCMVASKARRSSAALSADTPGGATNGRAMAEGPTMSSSKCCRSSEQSRTGAKVAEISLGPSAEGSAKEAHLRIYCDTSTLPENISGADPKSQKELRAIKELRKLGMMFGSHLVLCEVMNTKNERKRNQLSTEHAALAPIPKDEKLLGYNTTTDWRGGFACCPMISDVQDEAIRAELIAQGLEQRDAEHITQAVCNDCDVFLTRDERTIINPHRAWLERRFPKLKVWLPSELLASIQHQANGRQLKLTKDTVAKLTL